MVAETPKELATEAFVVHEAGADFKLTPIILDEVRDDEILVEMKYSGICHTVRYYPAKHQPIALFVSC
jgi:Zn-dependent alcohol dehydrogenase